TDFEAHTVTGSRRLGDDEVCLLQPSEIALEHLRLGERRFRPVDVVLEEMARQDRVSHELQRVGKDARDAQRTTIAANGTGKVDLHRVAIILAHMRLPALFIALLIAMTTPTSTQSRPRARDLGIAPGTMEPG